MLNFIVGRLKKDYKITIINLIGIIVVFIFMLFMINISRTIDNKHKEKLNEFDKNNIILYEDREAPYLQDLQKLVQYFGEDNVTRYAHHGLSATSTGYSIRVMATEHNFIHIGSLSSNYDLKVTTSEQLSLLYGREWLSNSDENVVIVDEDTAINTFGYVNVVNETINILNDEYLIIGVVTNTTDRNNQLKHCLGFGEPNACYEKNIPSIVYIPYKHYESKVSSGESEYVVIKNKDSSKVNDDVDWVIKAHNLNEDKKGNTILTKSLLIEQLGILNETFYEVMLFIVSTVFFLGFCNIVNSFIFSIKLRKKEYGILKSIGASNGQLYLVFLSESLIIGFGTSIIIFTLTLLFLVIYTLTNGLIAFFSFQYYVYTILIMTMLLPVLLVLVNTLLWGIVVKQRIPRLLKGLSDKDG